MNFYEIKMLSRKKDVYSKSQFWRKTQQIETKQQTEREKRQTTKDEKT